MRYRFPCLAGLSFCLLFLAACAGNAGEAGVIPVDLVPNPDTPTLDSNMAPTMTVVTDPNQPPPGATQLCTVDSWIVDPAAQGAALLPAPRATGPALVRQPEERPDSALWLLAAKKGKHHEKKAATFRNQGTPRKSDPVRLMKVPGGNAGKLLVIVAIGRDQQGTSRTCNPVVYVIR